MGLLICRFFSTILVAFSLSESYQAGVTASKGYSKHTGAERAHVSGELHSRSGRQRLDDGASASLRKQRAALGVAGQSEEEGRRL